MREIGAAIGRLGPSLESRYTRERDGILLLQQSAEWPGSSLPIAENLIGEDFAARNKRFTAYLIEHRWDSEMGEEDPRTLAAEDKFREK